jgi:hypothetical protein
MLQLLAIPRFNTPEMRVLVAALSHTALACNDERSGVIMFRKSSFAPQVTACLLVLAAWLPTAIHAQATPAVSTDLSGMFTFLREGEFVQLTVEDGQLSGFISRYGETDSDKDTFIDHFFDKTTLHSDHLYFKTKTVHAIWYEFDGTVSVAAGKHKGEEGYRVLRGKLTLHSGDAKGAEQASDRTVEFKSFPDMNNLRK